MRSPRVALALVAVVACGLATSCRSTADDPDPCATSRPLADGATDIVEVSVLTDDGKQRVALIDAGGRWWLGPSTDDGVTTVEIADGGYAGTVRRDGNDMELIIESAQVRVLLRDAGRCIDAM